MAQKRKVEVINELVKRWIYDKRSLETRDDKTKGRSFYKMKDRLRNDAEV